MGQLSIAALHLDDRDVPVVRVFQNVPQILPQLVDVDSGCLGRISVKLRQRFPELRFRPEHVAPGQVMETDRGLDQSLIEQPKASLLFPPQVFPRLVSLKIASRVEKNYPLVEQVQHTPTPSQVIEFTRPSSDFPAQANRPAY